MVPVEYEGLWRRSGIWRSNGTSDLTTQVWWFQSSRYHIDLRIPADRAGITAFAGETVVDGDRCEWRPAIAFPAISAELDAGWMRFDDPDHLHETGLDNSYEEDWYREPTGAMHGVRLQEVDGEGLAYLLISEHWMAWACGNEFTVYRRDHQWTAIASNLSGKEGHPVTLSLRQALQWRTGDLVELPMAPARSWRAAGSAQ
jgi:hypothetical protein